MLAQIIAGTPIWVFFIFFVLLYYGFVQSRTREAGRPRVVLLPVIMILLSLGGVLSSFAGQTVALFGWGAGVVAAVGLNRVVRAPAGVSYDPATQRFHLPGSWIPLALMMVIYFAKYTVGATTALRPDVAGSPTFAIVLSCVLGATSGTFFARFLQIWSASGRAAHRESTA